MEPGPVLSPGGGEEERLRVRRKLETLELELRGIERKSSFRSVVHKIFYLDHIPPD